MKSKRTRLHLLILPSTRQWESSPAKIFSGNDHRNERASAADSDDPCSAQSFYEAAPEDVNIPGHRSVCIPREDFICESSGMRRAFPSSSSPSMSRRLDWASCTPLGSKHLLYTVALHELKTSAALALSSPLPSTAFSTSSLNLISSRPSSLALSSSNHTLPSSSTRLPILHQPDQRHCLTFGKS